MDDSPSREELRTAAAQGVRWSAISRPIIEVVQFCSILVLARLIVPAEFGRYAIAGIAAESAKLLVAAGLSNALVQRKRLDHEHMQTGMALGLIAGLALTALTLAAAGLIVVPIFGSRTALFVAIMAPLCLVEALTTVPIATLRRRLAFRRLSELEILNTLVRVAVCVVLAFIGLGGEALVLGVVAGALVPGAIAWMSAPPPFPRLHRGAARELLGYAVPMSLASISWVGFGNIDYAIVGARLGPLQTGYYYRAYSVAVEYQGKIGLLMNQVGFPVLARAKSKDELTQLYSQMIRMLTIALFPLLALLAIAAPVAVPFLFGPRWAPAVVPTQILALGGASVIVFNGVGTVFTATGRVRALLGMGVGAVHRVWARGVPGGAAWPHGGRHRRRDCARGVCGHRLLPDAAGLQRTSDAPALERRCPGRGVVSRARRGGSACKHRPDVREGAPAPVAGHPRAPCCAGLPADPAHLLPGDVAHSVRGAGAHPARTPEAERCEATPGSGSALRNDGLGFNLRLASRS